MENYLRSWNSWKGCKSTKYPTRLEKRCMSFSHFWYRKKWCNSFYVDECSPEDTLIMDFSNKMDSDLLFQSEDFKQSLVKRLEFYKLL